MSGYACNKKASRIKRLPAYSWECGMSD